MTTTTKGYLVTTEQCSVCGEEIYRYERGLNNLYLHGPEPSFTGVILKLNHDDIPATRDKEIQVVAKTFHAEDAK